MFSHKYNINIATDSLDEPILDQHGSYIDERLLIMWGCH